MDNLSKFNQDIKDDCKTDAARVARLREQLPGVVEGIIDQCEGDTCYTHINYEPIPSRESVIEIINTLRRVVFPGYFSRDRLDPVNMRYRQGQAATRLFDMLGEEIGHAIRHDCFRYDNDCRQCEDEGYRIAFEFMRRIPSLRDMLAEDVQAVYDGDPAAKSFDEIIFSYPGIFALFIHRAAHDLFQRNVPLLPRIMSEYAHGETGIDIHPGANIGRRFAIDHGTGIVIGESTDIGNNVRIYQGVTLGALSLPPDAGNRLRGEKRHPTIEDDVIIYSGATILGGDAVIGARSVIGGNVWLTKSVPPDTTVILEKPRLTFKYNGTRQNDSQDGEIETNKKGINL